MRKVVRIPKHHKVINHIPTPKRKLIGLRSDLTQLIYWMEHDRSPDAQPDKIVLLKRQLVDLDPRINKGLMR